MKKEEILAKAQAEKKDEMENAVRDRSAVWMTLAMVVAAGFFVCMRGEDEPVFDLAAMVCFADTACFIYRFTKLKQTRYLIFAVVFAALTVFTTVWFFRGH